MNKPFDPFVMSYANPDLLTVGAQPVSPLDPFTARRNVNIEEVDSVDPLAGIAPMPGGPVIPVQNIESDLAWLRGELPFIPVMKFPTTVVSIFLPLAGTAADLIVPDGTVLGLFRGNLEYYVNAQGRAAVPSATSGEGNLYKPEHAWFYIGGHKQFSVVGTANNTFVQLVCLSPTNWNRAERMGRGV